MGKKLKMLQAICQGKFKLSIRSAEWKGAIKTDFLSGEGRDTKTSNWKGTVMDKFAITRIP